MISNVRYLPYGQERWTDVDAPSDKGYTGQRNETGFGLVDYNDPYQQLGRPPTAQEVQQFSAQLDYGN